MVRALRAIHVLQLVEKMITATRCALPSGRVASPAMLFFHGHGAVEFRATSVGTTDARIAGSIIVEVAATSALRSVAVRKRTVSTFDLVGGVAPVIQLTKRNLSFALAGAICTAATWGALVNGCAAC